MNQSIQNVTPKVTVLMTVYNDEQFIGYAINSILNQKFTNFEFLIVNDGSTDKTGEILSQYAEKDNRICIIHQDNTGTVAAANRGLKQAKGEYIARIDSDDISFIDRLSTQVEYLDNNPQVTLVGGGAQIIDTDGNIIGLRNIHTNNPGKTLLHRNIFQHSDVMFRKDIVDKLGGYREKFRNGEDYDLWLRISDISQVVKLNKILGQWRLNGSGYSFSKRREQKYFDKIIKQFALQRRKEGKDNYNSFNPSLNEYRACKLTEEQYNRWVFSYLFESLCIKEARIKARFLLKSYKFSAINYLLFLLTFIPVPIIKYVFKIRTIIKNNM